MDSSGSELTRFLDTHQDSAYPGEIIKKQRDPHYLQERIGLIISNDFDRQDAGNQANDITEKTKRVVQHFQGLTVSTHTTDFEFGAESTIEKLKRKLRGLFLGSGSSAEGKKAEAPNISGDTSSTVALSKTRSWIDLCNEQHVDCPRKDNVPLPSRLVEISEGESGHLIRLAETEGQHGRYACLSHPWGKQANSVVITTEDNYQKHIDDISFSSLSPLFKQAIVTAWRLGFHYMWIDSLCIIQRNANDWDVQASRMEAYYRQADVTLAASKADGPESGCYSLSDPEYLGRDISWSDKAGSQYTISHRRSIPHARGWPLSTRGWVYQERMLSPRTIHFGYQELVWECAQGSMCECGQATNFHSELSGKFEHHQLYASAPTAGDLRDAWRDTVQEYSNLDLTYHKDALPALAGLAREMQRVRGCRYLAGLWENTLVGDMLWLSLEPVSEDIQSRPRPESASGPTWSWASFEPGEDGACAGRYRISYQELGEKRSPSGLERCEQHIKTFYATIVSASCNQSGIDDFGQVMGGEIALNAPVVSGLLQIVPWTSPPEDDAYDFEKNYYEEHKDHLRCQLKMRDFDTMEVNEDDMSPNFVKFFPDYALYLPGRGHVANNTWVQVVKVAFVNGGPQHSPKNVLCLVLRDIGKDEGIQKYERIGLAICRKTRGKPDWFAKAESMTLHVI